MANINKGAIEFFEEYAGRWVTYSALASFLLYGLGYLVTRFELTMLGVTLNLDVLEERYLFAGARFLVYLLASIPSLLLLLSVPVAILWMIARWLPRRVRASAASFRANTFYVVGIVFAVALIQLVARQCFVFNNLLLARSLPGPTWLQAVLLDDQDQIAPFYFAGLVLAMAITAALLIVGNRRSTKENWSRFLAALLSVLLAIQALLLPINYSILITHKTFPQITGLPPNVAAKAWLIWENKEVVTLFVLRSNSLDDRAIVTVEAKQTYGSSRIVSYDPVLQILFLPSK